MKNKRFRVLITAALLALSVFAMTAYADEGWYMDNGTWVYLDSSGYRITNEWKKGADGLWRYLNSSGEMAIDCWCDDDYYVDSNGIMLSDSWLYTTPDFDRYGDSYWFYFASNGKLVKDCWKKIDGRQYLFDSDGIMQTGWTDDHVYYLGDENDGSMKTGWKYLAPPDDEEDDDYYYPSYDDGMYWYYFSSSGKKYSGEDATDGDYRISKIGDYYYCFNYQGRMQTGWVYLDGDPDTADPDTIEGWRYFAEAGISDTVPEGGAISGWLALEPPERLQDNVDDPVVWYYFSNKGVPKTGPAAGEASTNDLTKINGKTYLFDQRGNPASGLYKLEIGETGEYTSYYFDESSKTPVTGKKTIEEGDGTKSTFYFSSAGRGETGVKSNYLYYMGKRQEADSDVKYQPVSIPNGDGTYNTYVVNSSGRSYKSTSVKDADGNKYTVNSSGILTAINDEEVGDTISYGKPVEPVYEYDD